MVERLQIRISPRQASDPKYYYPIVAKELKVSEEELTHVELIKKSIDARKKPIVINMIVDAYVGEEFVPPQFNTDYPNVSHAKPVLIVGSGPAGLFAALKLIQRGHKPIIIERGADVAKRKLEVAQMYHDNKVNLNSNYCYGEGGAGTFSDGKLYTRSKKKGDIKEILEILVAHGAKHEILTDSHPHVGTEKLPNIIKSIREKIIECGGEVHFETLMTELVIENQAVKGIVCEGGKRFEAEKLILATGQSFKELYYLLHEQGIALEYKPFAVGVRIEHKQEIIDRIQYKNPNGRGDYLPPAEYSVAHQCQNRGIYSFCMCPGGLIIPSSTAEGELVVNGMSNSKRGSRFANSGFVVEIRQEDLKDFENYGVLAGLEFQKYLEQLAFEHASEGLKAPGQRIIDFIKKKKSTDLPKTSYLPGVISSPMHEWLPLGISTRMRDALVHLGKKMKGFLDPEAMMLGVESRTSSPVRIPRDAESLEHTQIKGLYPCGEGAGYSGGIVSSAIDGQRCAMKIVF